MFQAVLRNAAHPEYGAATVPFPIPRDEYDHVIELLGALEIGDAVQRDCRVDEIHCSVPILKRLEKVGVNIDEMDYLAKRLDSFTDQETAQFQSMAVKLGTFDMADFINLTFCCQQATVITDFSDLEKIGRNHLMTINGGCAAAEALENTDGRMIALKLILSKEGTVTPYGVVYDNGMKLAQLYDGQHFPGYHYERDMLAVGITGQAEPEDTDKITWLYFPASKGQIEHAMRRSGIADPGNMLFQFDDCSFEPEIIEAMDIPHESIFELNDLAEAVIKLSPAEQDKLAAAVLMAEPESASQIRHLAENLDQFDFVPGAETPADYGRYMIQESGRFEYEAELEEFYDYERYGLQRIEQESGMFTDRGYISYHGTLSLDELMMENSAEPGMQMGGM